MEHSSCIKTDFRDNICIITIDKPENGNKLDVVCMNKMFEQIGLYKEEVDCKVLIFTGSGNSFCSGGDIGNYKDASMPEILKYGESLVRLHAAIANFPKLTVAAVNGDALGGGLSIMAACDIVISVPEAHFAIPEIQNNLAPMISLLGIRNSLSRNQCLGMGALGYSMCAEQAFASGIVNAISTKGENIIEAALKFIHPFLDKNLFAYSMFKKFYNQSQGLSYIEQLECGEAYLLAMLRGLS